MPSSEATHGDEPVSGSCVTGGVAWVGVPPLGGDAWGGTLAAGVVLTGGKTTTISVVVVAASVVVAAGDGSMEHSRPVRVAGIQQRVAVGRTWTSRIVGWRATDRSSRPDRLGCRRR